MSVSGGHPDEGASVAFEEPPGALSVFINYRREDTSGIAIALDDRLGERFGADNVFLDVRALRPGVDWLSEIKSHGRGARVFIALIGPRWLEILKARQKSLFGGPAADEVRREIEMALSRGSGVDVIPILVDNAAMPRADLLPRSVRGLAARQAERLRFTNFDQDVEHLIEILAELRTRPPGSAHPAEPPVAGPTAVVTVERDLTPSSPASQVAPEIDSPDEHHYREVIKYMAGEGTVVPVLGPDAGDVAAGLSGRLSPGSRSHDIAEAAQYVYVTSGRPDLYRRLKQVLSVEREPGPVHRFLARFPGTLEERGLPKRYQLIVTTNYDTQLERAFDEENEPYDLTVYMSSGADEGKFVHFPLQSDPQPIMVPNDYDRLPIDVESYELERTVIVKILGAVDGSSGGYRWRENYVITEDHYIAYLSTGPVATLVPNQILTKLQDSHCLFLGYPIRDWNLRVFLKRVWGGEPLYAKSWAIQEDPDLVDKEFWNQTHVELFGSSVNDYATVLGRHMTAGDEGGAQG